MGPNMVTNTESEISLIDIIYNLSSVYGDSIFDSLRFVVSILIYRYVSQS